MDRASATETADLGSIPGRVKPKALKVDIYRFTSFLLTFSIKRDSVKPPSYEVDWWAGSSLSRTPNLSLRCLLAKASW